MVLYDEATSVCKQFKDIVAKWKGDTNSAITPNQKQPIQKPFYKDQNWKDGLPWLYYDRTVSEVLLEAKRVKFRASFGYENRAIGIINRFKYKLAIFELEGKFLGWQDLTDQLLLCRTSTG